VTFKIKSETRVSVTVRISRLGRPAVDTSGPSIAIDERTSLVKFLKLKIFGTGPVRGTFSMFKLSRLIHCPIKDDIGWFRIGMLDNEKSSMLSEL
jgi:hypothetical protein